MQAYAPLTITREERLDAWRAQPPMKNYVLHNRTMFTPSTAYRLLYTVLEDGTPIKTGEIPMPEAAPQSQVVFTFEPEVKMTAGLEYYITFSICQKEDTPYAAAGHEVGFAQFVLPGAKKAFRRQIEPTAHIDICESEEDILLASAGFSVRFCRSSGLITSISRDGTEYAILGALERFDRPWCGLDPAESWGYKCVRQDIDSLKRKLCSITVRGEGEGRAKVEVVSELTSFDDKNIIVNTGYTVYGSGKLRVCSRYEISEGFVFIPRVGCELVLPAGLENVEYYGYGETENYPDRMLCAKLGRYKAHIDDLHFPFIPPSENGGHEKTRWINISGDNGHGVCITADRPIHFDLHHNSIEDYKTARHDHELPRRGEAYLHLDAAHSPIGGDMQWSSGLDPREMVPCGIHELAFTLELF